MSVGEDPVYFLHIPKTAGTSLSAVLASKYPSAEICPAHHLSEFLSIPRERLATYKLFRGHFYFGIERFLPQTPRYITFLRDPVQRFFSNYQHIRRTPGHILNRRTQTLADFLRDPEARARIANFQTRSLGLRLGENIEQAVKDPTKGILSILEASMPEGVPQDEALFEIACERLNCFAFVGITEQFDESLSRLCATCGWTSAPSVPALNVSAQKTNTEELNAEALELIQELNRLDLKLYAHARIRLKAQEPR